MRISSIFIPSVTAEAGDQSPGSCVDLRRHLWQLCGCIKTSANFLPEADRLLDLQIIARAAVAIVKICRYYSQPSSATWGYNFEGAFAPYQAQDYKVVTHIVVPTNNMDGVEPKDHGDDRERSKYGVDNDDYHSTRGKFHHLHGFRSTMGLGDEY